MIWVKVQTFCILPLEMMFQASRPYFHQFSNGADVSVGLDFANMAEAQAFAKEVFVPVIFFGLVKWSFLGLFL